ncbi:MAG: histidinol-phosphate transaminase [Alphaproteobacteria bacterium]|nr:histidinol-phosphate transaminase [Alphaproteobacteria bacterium]
MPLKPLSSIYGITPYTPGKSKAAAGVSKIIKLSSNETPIGPSPKAIEAYNAAVKTLHRYPDGGSTQLRQAIAQVYELDADRIVCGAGSDEVIGMLCKAYAEAGSDVIYTEHGFLMYPIYAMIAGATPVAVKEADLRADIDAILAAVTPKTRIVFLANPNNPTGSYVTRDELWRLRKGLRDDILLVIDGAYAEYVSEKDYSDGIELVEKTDNTVVTRTFSKIYGLASLRIGWGYCPADVADVLNRVRGPFNTAACAQVAAVAAVLDAEHTAKAKAFNDEWLPWVSQQCRDMGLHVYPSVANFILISFPGGAQQAIAANDWLMERGIIPRMVANYGLPACLRITIGKEDENMAFVKSLKEFIG